VPEAKIRRTSRNVPKNKQTLLLYISSSTNGAP